MSRSWHRVRAASKDTSRTLTLEYLEDRWAPAAGSVLANVTYHGGPLLQHVQIESVYDGQAWSSNASLQQGVTQTDGFLQYFVTSPYMTVLQQYNVGTGTFIGHDLFNQDPANQTIDDSQIRQILDGEISSGHLAAPGPNSLYVFFTTPGVVVTAGGQDSVHDFSGYHDTFTDSSGATVYYAVVPYPNGNVADVQLSAFQQTTVVLSHEMAEAITDPDTLTGWYDSRLGEIGDIANNQLGLLHGYVVQGVWSQADAKVVIPSDTSSTSAIQLNAAQVHATAGQAFTGLVATITNAPASASFTATIDWGNGVTSDGMVTADPNGGFDVTGTNTYSQAGSFPLSVTVKDSSGTVVGTALGRASVTASAGNLQATGVVLTATFGQSFTGTVATFTYASAQVTAGSFTASINWGDGTTSTGTVTADPAGGFDVGGTHTYAMHDPADLDFTGVGHAHSFIIQVTITDTTTTTATTALSLATVSPAPPIITARGDNIAATAGQSFSGTVATFTDTNSTAAAGDFTASIDWGDGTTSTGTVTVDPNGGFDVGGTHTYSTTTDWFGIFNPFHHGDQHHLIHVSITDTQTQDSAEASSLATVAPTAANLTVVAQNITATFGQSFSGTVATFTDVNSSLGAGTFTATIDWGDGTTSSGVITASAGGGFTVSGTHTYSSTSDSESYWGGPRFDFDSGLPFGSGASIFPLTVTVQSTTTSDSGTSRSIATVSPAPSSVQATGVVISAVFGQSFSGTVANFTVPGNNTSTLTATINWGDGTSSTGTIVANTSGGFRVTGTHTYGDSGDGWFGHSPFHGGHVSGPQPFLISVTIQDSTNGSTATVASLASVTAAAPHLVAASLNLNPSAGTAFSGTVATFTDSNAAAASSYHATIYWGDGAISTGTVSPNGTSGFLVGGTHTYRHPGIFRVFVSIHDTDGDSAVTLGRATVSDGTLTSTLPPVALEFLTSLEYCSNVIIADYQQYLHRTPSSSEVAGWVSAMQHGLTDVQAQASFLSSGEFYVRAGNTPRAWIDNLYQTLLGRAAEGSGESFWLQQMASAGNYAVALGIATSPEHESIVVRGYYQKYLGRSAGAQEVNNWVHSFESGVTNNQIIATFMGSQEYFLNHNANASDWIFSAYQNLLSRNPDQAGLDGWLTMLGPRHP
jgi:hypothetical protein